MSHSYGCGPGKTISNQTPPFIRVCVHGIYELRNNHWFMVFLISRSNVDYFTCICAEHSMMTAVTARTQYRYFFSSSSSSSLECIHVGRRYCSCSAHTTNQFWPIKSRNYIAYLPFNLQIN